MAFLLLLHEKMRLQRKVNKLTLKQCQASSRKERVTKQIERVQKMYSKRQESLKNMATRMQNAATLQFKNAFGCAMPGAMPDPRGYLSGGTFNNMGAANVLDMMFQKGLKNDYFNNAQSVYQFAGQYKKGYDKTGNEVWVPADAQLTKGDDGKTYYDEAVTSKVDQETIRKQMAAANELQQMATWQYQQNQAFCTNAISNYQNDVSIWLEYQENMLEAEQDEALAPLQEQETEWDMESTSAETQLADARARLDAIKQALSEGIKDSAPTFGLG